MIVEREYSTHKIRFINADSNIWLLDSPIYDLTIDDPNYGMGASKPNLDPTRYRAKQKNGTVLNVKINNYKHNDWDDKPAETSYFDLLLKKTKNQIIWGANHYDYVFGKGRIVWDKLNGESDQYGCEIAYNILNDRTDMIYYMWAGMFQGENISKDVKRALIQQGNKKLNEKRIHPTQKPLKLCEWQLFQFAKKGWSIFDGHGGSGNMAIACHRQKYSLDIVEKDKQIFTDMVKHYDVNTSQNRIEY